MNFRPFIGAPITPFILYIYHIHITRRGVTFLLPHRLHRCWVGRKVAKIEGLTAAEEWFEKATMAGVKPNVSWLFGGLPTVVGGRWWWRGVGGWDGGGWRSKLVVYIYIYVLEKGGGYGLMLFFKCCLCCLIFCWIYCWGWKSFLRQNNQRFKDTSKNWVGRVEKMGSWMMFFSPIPKQNNILLNITTWR